MNSNFRNFAIWVIIGLLLIALFNLFQGPVPRANSDEINYSEFLTKVNEGGIRDVTISGRKITGHLSNDRAFQT